MAEKEFWNFLKKALAKGKIPQISMVRDSEDLAIDQVGKFLWKA